MPDVTWVVLTQGDRPDALRDAIASLTGSQVVLVLNAPGDPSADPGVEMVRPGKNVGVPAGRDLGLRATSSSVVGFLDDDAVAPPGVTERVAAAFDADPQLGAVALRIVDETGHTARRHVPRFGGRRAELGGEVALVLGGACAVRREAYDGAGGYWGELFYGHEEVEFCWRLVDHGWSIRYLADVAVVHPRTDVGRHRDGWRLTGRNRVMIARRSLPWPIALAHVAFWLALGLVRAPGPSLRHAYWTGWLAGWRHPVDRAPIHWRTVWRLSRLGRPPVL